MNLFPVSVFGIDRCVDARYDLPIYHGMFKALEAIWIICGTKEFGAYEFRNQKCLYSLPCIILINVNRIHL